MIVCSASMLPENKTSEKESDAIILWFKRGRYNLSLLKEICDTNGVEFNCSPNIYTEHYY